MTTVVEVLRNLFTQSLGYPANMLWDSLQSEPGIYTEWSSTDTHKMHYLTIPSDFEGYSGLLSLSVCIRKCISSEFEVEAEETEEVFGNEDNDIANGALQVVLADPGVLDCSICHEPLCTHVFQV
ncbi:hypothetical protein Tco_0049161 [Tanacetum coccineum]